MSDENHYVNCSSCNGSCKVIILGGEIVRCGSCRGLGFMPKIEPVITIKKKRKSSAFIQDSLKDIL